MAMGALPITNRHAGSNVAALTGRFDLGHRANGNETTDWLTIWVESVLAALQRPPEELSALRKEMRMHMRVNNSWGHTANAMASLF